MNKAIGRPNQVISMMRNGWKLEFHYTPFLWQTTVGSQRNIIPISRTCFDRLLSQVAIRPDAEMNNHENPLVDDHPLHYILTEDVVSLDLENFLSHNNLEVPGLTNFVERVRKLEIRIEELTKEKLELKSDLRAEQMAGKSLLQKERWVNENLRKQIEG